MKQIPLESIGSLLSLIIHDLRNPTATLSANLSFIHDVYSSIKGGILPEEEKLDFQEALQDSLFALSELMHGLDSFSLIARWFSNRDIIQIDDGDLRAELYAIAKRKRQEEIDLQIDDELMLVKGGSVVPQILEILLANSSQYAPFCPIIIRAYSEDNADTIVEIQDRGCAVAEDLRDKVFTLEGQISIKGRREGRYSRVAGLLAASILANCISASLEADGKDGEAIFRLRLQSTKMDRNSFPEKTQ